MKRSFDISCSLIATVLLSLPMLLVAVLVRFTSFGSIIYWPNRIGRCNTIFKMPRFHTMMTSQKLDAKGISLGSEELTFRIGDNLNMYLTP